MINTIRDLASPDSLRSYDLSFLDKAGYGGWRIEKDTCQFIGRVCETLRPRTVLEFGTGLSTLVLTHEAAKGNVGRICSIDHLADFPGHPKSSLAGSGEDRFVNFYHCPLGLNYLAGKFILFYKVPRDIFSRIRPVDLVIVDGPPYFYNGREAALYMVYPFLAPNALVLLDDANRKNREQVYVSNWKYYYGRNIEEVTFLNEFSKGLSCIWLSGQHGPVNAFPFAQRCRDSGVGLRSALTRFKHVVQG